MPMTQLTHCVGPQPGSSERPKSSIVATNVSSQSHIGEADLAVDDGKQVLHGTTIYQIYMIPTNSWCTRVPEPMNQLNQLNQLN